MHFIKFWDVSGHLLTFDHKNRSKMTGRWNSNEPHPQQNFQLKISIPVDVKTDNVFCKEMVEKEDPVWESENSYWPIPKRLNDILFIFYCSTIAMSYFVSMHHFQLDLHDLFNKQVSFQSLHFICMTLPKMTMKNLRVKTSLVKKDFFFLSPIQIIFTTKYPSAS